MTPLREAAQQALEGLEKWQDGKDPRGADDYITALKAALAEPVQEPAAWAAVTENGKLYKAASTRESAERKAEQQEAKFGDTWKPLHVVPLYTAPPQRRPLTDEEIQELSQQHKFDSRMEKFVRIIERAHKIGGQDESA